MPARRADYLLQFEALFRTPPAAAAKVIPFTDFDVKRDARRQTDGTVSSRAIAAKSDRGDPTAGGNFSSILDLRAAGNWLKALLGAPSVGKAVTTQPVNVTGVSVNYAEADCPVGNGTLSFTFIGTTLAWTPQGGLIGAAINVGAGGNFLLEGGGGGKRISVSVTGAALPGANQADANINVHATLKAHVFPFNLAQRPSFLLERQEKDINKFYRFLGNMLNRLSWDILANDQNFSGDIISAVEVDPVPGAAFDANPTSYAKARACAGSGRIWDGSGVGLGTLVGGTVGFDNQMTPYPVADGLEGYGYIDQGDVMLGGRLQAVFEGDKAYQLARDGVSSRMRLQTTAPVGADTFGIFLDMPQVELVEQMPSRRGKSGLFADLEWKAHQAATDPVIYLVNDVAAF